MGRFAKLVAKLRDKGESEGEATGVAAKVGREKYGKKKFSDMASAGRRKAIAANLTGNTVLSNNLELAGEAKPKGTWGGTAAGIAGGILGARTIGKISAVPTHLLMHASLQNALRGRKKRALAQSVGAAGTILGGIGAGAIGGYKIGKRLVDGQPSREKSLSQNMGTGLMLSGYTDEQVVNIVNQLVAEAYLEGRLGNDPQALQQAKDVGLSLGFVKQSDEGLRLSGGARSTIHDDVSAIMKNDTEHLVTQGTRYSHSRLAAPRGFEGKLRAGAAHVERRAGRRALQSALHAKRAAFQANPLKAGAHHALDLIKKHPLHAGLIGAGIATGAALIHGMRANNEASSANRQPHANLG